MALRSKQDFYLALMTLIGEQPEPSRDLEDYLRALLGCSGRVAHLDRLSAGDILNLLQTAFTAEAVPFAQEWRGDYDTLALTAPGYEGWRNHLIRQIVDLRDMAESGQLADPRRYFGLRSPRGNVWYNFDPCTWLECGMSGALAGWSARVDSAQPLPDSPATFLNVYDETRATDDSAVIGTPSASEIPDTEFIPLGWADFIDFIECGQGYE